MILPYTSTPVIIGVAYHRADDNSSLTSICNCIRYTMNQNPNTPVILLGDWNAHHEKWNNNSRLTNGYGNELDHLIQQCKLTIVNNQFISSRYQSTHIKGGVLDLILTSHPHLFKSCHIKPDQLRLISDHYPILARLEMVSDQHVNHVPHRDKRYMVYQP